MIKISGVNSRAVLKLHEPITSIQRIALAYIGFENNICNVTENNTILIGNITTEKYVRIDIEKGYWTIDQLNLLIQAENKDFKLELVNERVKMTVPLNIMVDLGEFHKFLGFNKQECTITPTWCKGNKSNYFLQGTHIAENNAKLKPFEVIEVHCNLVESGFTQHDESNHIHKEHDLLYCFSHDVPYGKKVSHATPFFNYLNVKDHYKEINQIIIELRSETGELIENPRSELLIYLKIDRLNE